MRFRDLFYGLVPDWLRRGDGERMLCVLGLMLDAFVERLRLSQEASDPSTAPADALPYIGRDRRIRRGINEPADAYAARLLRYLDDHMTQGNPFALMDQLYAYLQTDGVTLRTVDRRGNWFERAADGTRSFTLDQANWDWDGGVLSAWARFWVVIFTDQGPWSFQWAHPGGTSTDGTIDATADEIAGVRTIVREWMPAGTRCEWIVVCEDDPATKFGPTTGDDPLGAWGRWSDGAANARPVRDASARYWLGPR
jgi:hypothetical protein